MRFSSSFECEMDNCYLETKSFWVATSLQRSPRWIFWITFGTTFSRPLIPASATSTTSSAASTPTWQIHWGLESTASEGNCRSTTRQPCNRRTYSSPTSTRRPSTSERARWRSGEFRLPTSKNRRKCKTWPENSGRYAFLSLPDFPVLSASFNLAYLGLWGIWCPGRCHQNS